MSVSDKMFLALAIVVMLGVYAIFFLERGHFSRLSKRLGGKSNAGDDAMIATGLQKKHQQMLDRIEEEKERGKLLDVEKQKKNTGESSFPTRTTKDEWIDKEYKVGEDKESFFPESKK